MRILERREISTVILIITLTWNVYSQCCLESESGRCVLCPQDMHLYRYNCVYNLPHCRAYANGFDCSECDSGYKLTRNDLLGVEQCRKNEESLTELLVKHKEDIIQYSPESINQIPQFVNGFKFLKQHFKTELSNSKIQSLNSITINPHTENAYTKYLMTLVSSDFTYKYVAEYLFNDVNLKIQLLKFIQTPLSDLNSQIKEQPLYQIPDVAQNQAQIKASPQQGKAAIIEAEELLNNPSFKNVDTLLRNQYSSSLINAKLISAAIQIDQKIHLQIGYKIQNQTYLIFDVIVQGNGTVDVNGIKETKSLEFLGEQFPNQKPSCEVQANPKPISSQVEFDRDSETVIPLEQLVIQEELKVGMAVVIEKYPELETSAVPYQLSTLKVANSNKLAYRIVFKNINWPQFWEFLYFIDVQKKQFEAVGYGLVKNFEPKTPSTDDKPKLIPQLELPQQENSQNKVENPNIANEIKEINGQEDIQQNPSIDTMTPPDNEQHQETDMEPTDNDQNTNEEQFQATNEDWDKNTIIEKETENSDQQDQKVEGQQKQFEQVDLTVQIPESENKSIEENKQQSSNPQDNVKGQLVLLQSDKYSIDQGVLATLEQLNSATNYISKGYEVSKVYYYAGEIEDGYVVVLKMGPDSEEQVYYESSYERNTKKAIIQQLPQEEFNLLVGEQHSNVINHP